MKKRLKRVFIYGINYAPEPIGVGRYSGEIGDYLISQNIQVEVVTAVPHYPGWSPRNNFQNKYSIELADKSRIIRCPLWLKKDMRGIWRLLAPLSFAITSAPVAFVQILKTRPDVVLCVEPTLLAAPVAILAAKLARIRCVLHIQDLEIDAAFAMQHLKGRLLCKIALMLERLLLNRFDKIITISKRMQEKIIQKGVVSSKVCLVRNWVDLQKVHPIEDVSRYRSELGISADKFIALYAGNIGAKQKLSVVLEAASELTKEPDILFVIAGEGPERKRLVATYGHLSNVRFLPIQPENRLCELLSLANVHILPQDQGAADLVLPSKLGGMLASGRPSIVMADPGTELYDFLENSALLITPGAKNALVDAILSLYRRTATLPDQTRSLAEAFDASKCLRDLQFFLAGTVIG